ncbi:MAG: branched-chain amino acid ABC transporter permease [Verrucomicrobia bacterium]|nr:branched-chain amino acid ABC transporter permease [Verrucomicrobiota bacterium]
MDYLLHILILIGIYAILSVSLDLIAGYAGMLSVAHAAFYGVGAYVGALMALRLGAPFLVNLICAFLLGGFLGALVGVTSLRLRNQHVVITTFALQVAIFSLMNNWLELTRGPLGIPGIPRPVLFGLKVSTHLHFLLLVLAVSAATLWAIWRITLSPFGRVLAAIREDEAFAEATGKNVAACKVLVFLVGGGFAAVGGVLYAYYISFVDPTSFTIMESIFIICIVVVGGAGSSWGPVLGAIILVGLPELLRFLGLPAAVAAGVRQVIYGVALVTFVMWRPQGVLGKYSFDQGGS